MSTCAKVRFRDELGAKIALSQIAVKDGAKRRERRAYRCPRCRGWHLTSQEKNNTTPANTPRWDDE